MLFLIHHALCSLPTFHQFSQACEREWRMSHSFLIFFFFPFSFQKSNNSFGLANWRKYIGIVGPHTPPYVYTYAIWGSNISTLYGIHVDSFDNVTIIESFYRNGDVNQEDIDNEACKVWNTTMPNGMLPRFPLVPSPNFLLTYNRVFWLFSSG